MRLKSGHWILITATAVITVLLLLAPHHVSEKQADQSAAVDETPTVENDIDDALAIIASEAPMQGILKLRSIAEEHPENFRAQFHLGRFSAQTGQWEKVIERFETVKRIDPTFAESDYWIGLAKFNLGEKENAVEYLERFVAGEENNQELVNEASIMLNQIK